MLRTHRIFPLGTGLLAAAAIMTLGVAGVAAAKPGHGLHCGKGHAKHSKAIGKTCGKGHAKTRAPKSGSEKAKRQNAAKACRAEQKTDPAAFKAKYGTNGNGHNAFGKCVSSKAKSSHSPSGGSSSGEGSGSSSDTPGSGSSGTETPDPAEAPEPAEAPDTSGDASASETS